MNSNKLLDIIKCLLTEENIYELFKNHGYEGDIETLKLDLKNLLDDVIKSDEELSSVAGGKLSKVAAGAVAALTCFQMPSYAFGNANTSQTNSSAFNKISDSIKSGAKKVGEATKKYVIEPVKDTAQTIVRNPGKSAMLTTAVGVAYLLGVLSGKKLASPPEVDTQGMTDDEKQKIEKACAVFKELTEGFYIEISDDSFNWNLSKLKKKPNSINEKTVTVGKLAEKMLTDDEQSSKPYKTARQCYIDYETAQLNTLKNHKKHLEDKHRSELEQVTNELEKLKKQKEESESQQTKELEQVKNELNELKNTNQQLKKDAVEIMKKAYESSVFASDEPLMIKLENTKQENTKQEKLTVLGIRPVLRENVNTLLPQTLTTASGCKFETLIKNKKLNELTDLCIGDVFPLAAEKGQTSDRTDAQLEKYREKKFLSGYTYRGEMIADMQTTKFWKQLLLAVDLESKKYGFEDETVLSGILYCLLWGQVSVDYWAYVKNILIAIQSLLTTQSERPGHDCNLLTKCLSALNIKYEGGFLKWKNPTLDTK